MWNSDIPGSQTLVVQKTTALYFLFLFLFTCIEALRASLINTRKFLTPTRKQFQRKTRLPKTKTSRVAISAQSYNNRQYDDTTRVVIRPSTCIIYEAGSVSTLWTFVFGGWGCWYGVVSISNHSHGRKVSVRLLHPTRSPVNGMDVRTSVVYETANSAPAFHRNTANPTLFTMGVRPLPSFAGATTFTLFPIPRCGTLTPHRPILVGRGSFGHGNFPWPRGI